VSKKDTGRDTGGVGRPRPPEPELVAAIWLAQKRHMAYHSGMASDVLTAARALGLHAERESDVIDQIRRGLPARTIETVEDRLGLSQSDVAIILKVPERTLTRRRAKPDERLPADESDRVFRIARILNFAIEALGDQERAKIWLRSPNVSLGGVVPLTLLDTEPGARSVEDALGRIMYGIFA